MTADITILLRTIHAYEEIEGILKQIDQDIFHCKSFNQGEINGSTYLFYVNGDMDEKENERYQQQEEEEEEEDILTLPSVEELTRSGYDRRESEAILAILSEADIHCSLLERVSRAAQKQHIPFPTSPESLLSSLLFLAGSLAEEAEKAQSDGMAKEDYNVSVADDIAENWQTLAHTRQYIIQLLSYGVVPASIIWEPANVVGLTTQHLLDGTD